MRTFSNQATLTGLEDAVVRQAWLKVESSDELLRFSQYAVGGASSMDVNICQSAFINGTTGILEGRDGASAYLTPTNYSAGTGLHVGSANGSRVVVEHFSANRAAMKGSFDANGDFYTACWEGSNQAFIYKGTLSGGSITWSDYSADYIPGAMTATDDFVRRIDAVLYTTLGVIVVMGHYNGAEGVYTQTFFLVESSGTICKLDTIAQRTVTPSKLPAWYSAEKWGSFAAAKANGDTITVVVCDGTRALQFHIRNGIESQLEPIIDIEPTISTHKFYPTSLEKIGSLFYLAGRMTRTMSDNSTQILEMYLTSEDMYNWSVGEYSSFITQTASYLVLPTMASFTPGHIYAIGAGYLYRAPVRAMDVGGALTDITDKVLMAGLECGTNAADAAQVATHHYQALTDTLPGRVLDISAGLLNGAGTQYGGKLGRFVVNQQPETINAAGRNATQVDAIDLASWKLINWKANTDIDRWSSALTEDDMKDASLLIKTPQLEITFDESTRFTSKALNNPFVGYTSTRDNRDGFARMLARFKDADDASLSSVGFVFGASDNNFNCLLIPRNNTYTTEPMMRRSNLAPSDSEGNGGWNLTPRKVSVWESWLDDAYATLTKHPNASASSSDQVYYNGSVFDADKDYLLTLRIQGKRVQLYARENDLDAATQVAHSAQSLVYEWKANEHSPLRHASQSFMGVIAGTDVWCDPTAFEDGAYADLEQSLTNAENDADPDTFGALAWPCDAQTNGAQLLRKPTGPYLDTSYIIVGQWVRVIIPSQHDGMHLVESVSSTAITFKTGMYLGTDYDIFKWGISGTSDAYLYTQNPADEWGTADSSMRTFVATEADELGDLYLFQDPKAKKHPRKIRGRAGFISNDSSAISIRYIETDGSMFSLRSGDENLTRLAWDRTNPLNEPPGTESAYNKTQYGGSTPQTWRVMMHHGYVFEGSPSDKGLPAAGGYMIVEDEIIRYRPFTFKRRGCQPGDETTWTIVPAYYAPLKAVAAGPVTTIENWHNDDGAYPGDNLGTIPYATGLLVTITNQSGSVNDEGKQYYVASQPASYQLALDKSYPHAISGCDTRAGTMPLPPATGDWGHGDVAIVSGRGQMNTGKTEHAADSVVAFYPTPDAGIIDELIRVKKFMALTGIYNSAEDDIKYLSNLAGARNIQFRDNGSYNGTLSTTPQTLSSSEQDFVLALNAHLYAGSDNRLRIKFRNDYLLDIRAYTDSTLRTLGRNGVVRLQLAMPNSSITIGGADQKWVDQVDVHVSDNAISGSMSGTTFTEDNTTKHNIRVICRRNILTVEMDGQSIWQFDLSDYDSTGAYTQTAGPVTINYTASNSQNVTARLVELSDEVENHIIDMGTQGSGALEFVRAERHILSRSTQNGGLEFSRYLNRDQEATLTENSINLQPRLSVLDGIGHINVSGAEFGEWADEAWMQQNGYKFDMGSNRLLDTVSDSRREARTIVRGLKESTKTMTVQGVARLAVQPEGKVTVAFTNSGDAPSFASEDFVVSATSIQIAPQQAVFNCSYELRKYYAF